MIDGTALTWLADLCWVAAGLALLPAVMTAVNLPLFRQPQSLAEVPCRVSVILPARNEEAEIGGCVRALLASEQVDLEVIVVDDQSTDRTADIVRGLAWDDRRVRLHTAPPLPAGWSGKQHACFTGAAQASHPVLMFMDCDVRVVPAAVASMADFLRRSGTPLVSGFPRERTASLGEAVLIPLIHVLLLGYLPMLAMRLTRQVGLGAGCGQVMLADAAVYRATRGHAMIRASWHDGLTLPRAFRRCGHLTDIFDATALAECRMYRGFLATWRGLSKNAREGMATRAALPTWTVLLGGGLVAPFVLLPLAWMLMPWTRPTVALSAGVLALLAARLMIVLRFRQNWFSILLLPFGAAMLLALQWWALLGRPNGSRAVWRGRTQFSQ